MALATLSMYYAGAKTIAFQLFSKHKSLEAIPRKEGKVAIITGGNAGIGFETVRGLCKSGMSVIIGCRSENAAEAAIQTLKEQQPDAKVRYIHLDLSDLSSVSEFARQVHESESELHLLVNNAGVMLTPYGLTKDDFEQQLGICHFGHFALTMLLLDKMKISGKREEYARIVTVSSTVHEVGHINFDDLQSKKYYSDAACYAQAKLANIMFTYALQKRLQAEGCYVTANTLHPGVIDSGLWKHIPWLLRAGNSLLLWTPEQGAATSLYASLSPEVEAIGGRYFYNCEDVATNSYTHQEDIQEKLWEISCELTGTSDK